MKRGNNSIKSSISEVKAQKTGKKKIIIWLPILCVIIVLLLVAGIYFYQALEVPDSLFTEFSIQNTTSKPMHENIDFAIDKSGQPPAETAAMLPNQNIVNVLLLGLDLDYKPYAPGGGDYHTDAIIVLAINFDKNKVDMISLPRDTFTHVPGIKGIYKLNAAINCGGGKTKEGFNKVCEAASWLLGGINIDYYYAFELDTVIEIGDMIGGVDFDVDMAYKGMSDIYYEKGMQHLDGTGIYDYMRARKRATGEPGDKGRMNRCKAMLKAIFKKLKEENRLTQIPSLLATVSGGLYTNVTTQQSIALAYYAYNQIDMDDIGSHTLDGKLRSALGWNFYFIDQEYRKELINEIYGLEVPELEYVSYEYAIWLDNYGFKTSRYLATAQEVLQYSQNTYGIDHLSAEQQKEYYVLKEAYLHTQEAYDAASLTLGSAENSILKMARDNLRKRVEVFAKSINYPNKLSWTIKSAWNEDPCINEIIVDFR